MIGCSHAVVSKNKTAMRDRLHAKQCASCGSCYLAENLIVRSTQIQCILANSYGMLKWRSITFIAIIVVLVVSKVLMVIFASDPALDLSDQQTALPNAYCKHTYEYSEMYVIHWLLIYAVDLRSLLTFSHHISYRETSHYIE